MLKFFLFIILFYGLEATGAVHWYVSPDGTNTLADDNGKSPENPLQTIAYAFNQAAQPGDTVFVMDGVYRNGGFGSGDLDNGPVAYLNNSGTEGLPIVLTTHSGHHPIIEFDGAGGFTGGQIEHVAISGFTIIGPAENITTDQAMEHRLELPRPNYFNGRGIAIWGPANHITITDNTVSFAPGSGIRVNKGDYIYISHNRIFNNCWYTSAAESALVIAEALSINNADTIKIRLENNKVWGNRNKIPFFTPNPPDIGVPNYGTAEQDFIIDGSGVYITRNKDYDAGWFYLANNISFNNGINGLVVHRTDRAIVINNTSYMNGATPLESGRQNSSGITINNSDHVRVYNNISYARYSEDFALGRYGTLSDIKIDANIIFNGHSPFDSGYLYADPLFVNPDTIEIEADFRLQHQSPAIAEGVVNEWLPLHDFAGNPVDNHTPDIGALQYAGSVNIQEVDTISLELNVFPNPSADIVHIQLIGNHPSATVTVYDMQGRKVLPGKTMDKTDPFTIDVSGWPRGIYLIRLHSGQSQARRKLNVF